MENELAKKNGKLALNKTPQLMGDLDAVKDMIGARNYSEVIRLCVRRVRVEEQMRRSQAGVRVS